MSVPQHAHAAMNGTMMDGSTLIGRAAECARLEQETRSVRAGHSAVLVLRGGHGLGKTALLDHTARRAGGCRIIRARAVESEMQLPYAALHLLLTQLLDDLVQLPSRQRDALATVIDDSPAREPDRFLLGLATLNLLARAANPKPLICIVDDAQWLDQPSAQVLVFVARRIESRPVMVLLATRDQQGVGDLHGLPELPLKGLSYADARLLLGRAIPGRMDEPVVERIIEEARGDPLALLELPRAVSPAELAGGFGLTASWKLSTQIDDYFLEQVLSLPWESRQLLLTAAAEPLGDPSLLWRAAAELQLPRAAAEPPTSAGLLSLAPLVTFPRPSLRFAVYGLPTNEERRDVHCALALATDSARDPDRYAWHLAQAADEPDEEIAQELERCAPQARRRGGLAAAAAFLERATLLSSLPGRRAERALTAADAMHRAGADSAATRLLLIAEMSPLNDQRQGRLDRQRAQMASCRNGGNDAPRGLVRAARQLEAFHPQLARATHLEALAAAMSAGRLQRDCTTADIAKLALTVPPAAEPGPSDRLLDGLTARFTQGRGESRELLAQALMAFHDPHLSDEDARWLGLAARVAADLWDDEAWHTFTARGVQHTKEAGAVADLPTALDQRAIAEVHFGEFAVASDLVHEAAAISRETGVSPAGHASLLLAAWRGREDRARQLFGSIRAEALGRGEGLTLTIVGLSAAVLFSGLGRYDRALASAREATDNAGEPEELEFLSWALAELVEAGARTGDLDAAVLALQQLTERTRGSTSEWALGIEARSRALISGDDDAERFYREAVDRLARCRIRAQLARAHLLYGEWLRRQGRRSDARLPLHAASECFATMGAATFAKRAQRELLATGERTRRRSIESSKQLTPQEARIAAMASDGLSNPEIGARIWLSTRTVEYHLHKVFAKLGITSRTELHLVLPETADSAVRAPA